ncbi:hypothetical protein [Labrys monachus]|uniref:Uncharacterized protein n=1 Tax=Labrys monachus TaxID=217067 RepID=A0ABU0FCH9_9HYPH|nr:hypothetical protein [Labrys monachus]MDQ0392241.1 hypothetical protein [Labrys monachus]
MISEQFHPEYTQQAGERGQHLADIGVASLEGVNKAAIEAHDFLFGPTPEDQKSSWRKAREANFNRAAENTPVAGLAGATSQFATGMVGLGELTAGLKLLPWVARGVEVAEGYINGSSLTRAGAEAAKTSIVSATAFDPHQEGLSNLIQQYPSLRNPITALLAHQPGESDAVGRLRNVMENLGIEAGTGALLIGGVKLYKALASGDRPAIAAATDEVLKAHQQADTGGQGEQPAAGASAPGAQQSGSISPVAPAATVETAAQLKARLSDAKGYFDMGAAGAKVASEVGTALSQGKRVTIYPDGKPVEITAVTNGMMTDAQGQRWGSTPLVAQKDMNGPAIRIEEGGSSTLAQAPPDLPLPPVPKYLQPLNDTRGQGTQYHGTSDPTLQPSSIHASSRNYYGQGFYTTDAVDVAHRYSRRGSQDTGSRNLYEVTETRPLNILDAEQPLSEYLKSILLGHPEHPGEADAILSYALRDNPRNLRELYDGIREHGTANGLSTNDVQDLFDSLKYNLQQHGYDGISHLGGLQTGTAAHKVTIYFDPEKDLTVTPRNFDDFRSEEVLNTPEARVEAAKEYFAAAREAEAKPAADTMGTEGQPKAPEVAPPEFDPEMTLDIVAAVRKDWDATLGKGIDWNAALEGGQRFASPPNALPYNKMASPEAVEGFINNAVVALNRTGWLDEGKGWAILSDAKVQQTVSRLAEAAGADPVQMMGDLARAGAATKDMVAHMEVGYLLANKYFQDAYVSGLAIKEGRLDQWGGDALAAATQAKAQLAYAAQALKHANAIRAAGGRIVRRNRAEFMPDPEMIASIQDANPDMLAQILATTKGDVRSLRGVIQPSFLRRLRNFADLYYASNLLYGWKTQVNNIVSNAVTAVVRPAERIVGASLMGSEGASVREQAVRQYAYMASAIPDAWHAAVEAFKLGDSKLAMYNTDLYGTPLYGNRALAKWKPVNNVADLAYNGAASFSNFGQMAVGGSLRFLTAADEAAKMITYRGVVGSKAHIEAAQMGLTGRDLDSFVNDRLAKAFDDQGRATDVAAKREAQTATFSNDLDSGILAAGGRALQSVSNQFPPIKWLVPFVKASTNIARLGVNVTPGLNLLSNDFRAAWAGKKGDTQAIRMMNMAQARGQMTLGSLFMGTAYLMASGGMITGGGPTDPKARRDLMATGWRPYSIRRGNADGATTYVPFRDYLGPYAVPFTIAADLAEAIHHPEAADGSQTAISSFALALSKQMADSTYLQGLSQALDLIASPTPNAWERTAGDIASGFVPMSAALRDVNRNFGDDTMRDARSIVDRLLANIPGLSTGVPPRRDTWGDPIHARLAWSTTVHGEVDHEMERLAMDTADGRSIAGLTPTGPGYDLRSVYMADGRNAWDRYQELGGHLPGAPSLKSLVAKVMQTPAYRRAPDGAATIKGTRLYLLGSVINPYHDKAKKALMADPNVRQALYAANEAVRSAYAAKQRDPQGAIPQAQTLDKILTGVGLPGIKQP